MQYMLSYPNLYYDYYEDLYFMEAVYLTIKILKTPLNQNPKENVQSAFSFTGLWISSRD